VTCRREELKEAVTSSDKAQELLHKYSLEALGESLLAYVTKARAALGPPLLKVRQSFANSATHFQAGWMYCLQNWPLSVTFKSMFAGVGD